MYKQDWTEFEVHSLAYGILRKNLFPGYLVRGEHRFSGGGIVPDCVPDISVWKAFPDKDPALRFVIEVKKSPNGHGTAQELKYEEALGVPCVYIRGKDEAYKVMSKVSHLL